MLARFRPGAAAAIPPAFKAKDGTWYGFAARARILLVNTRWSPRPTGPRARGPDRPPLEGADRPGQAPLRHHGDARRLPVRRLGRGEGPRLLRGAEGQRRPDPRGQQERGAGRRRGPDRRRPDRHRRRGRRAGRRQPGGDRLSRPPPRPARDPVPPQHPGRDQGGAPPRAAEALADDLLGPEVEAAPAPRPRARSRSIRASPPRAQVETPRTVHAMDVDFEAAAKLWDRVAAFLASEFAG